MLTDRHVPVVSTKSVPYREGIWTPSITWFPGTRGSIPPSNGISIGSGVFAGLTVVGWWRGTVVERRSLAGELSLSCARPAADG